jgi:hypothetical protein
MLKMSHKRRNERSHLRMVWNHVDIDSMNLQDGLARRPHRRDDDSLVQSADEFALKADAPRDLE